MEANWLSIDEFSKTVEIDRSTIKAMIDRNELESKEEAGVLYVDASNNTKALIPEVLKEASSGTSADMVVQQQFVEKTIGTIMNLHEKVLVSKDETIVAMKDENTFLKEAVISMQELYNEDRKTVETLAEQLKLSQEEVTFLRRKYKLMWGKVVEDYASPKKELKQA
ncbi:MAG: DUF3972 domain-containing protein [Thiovulaceae bacterium]|nr:DUF3972 domain-containing protein [Sulfurimonadaceae bacterium]